MLLSGCSLTEQAKKSSQFRFSVNLFNLLFDTSYSIMIYVLTGNTTWAIVLGIIIILIRCSEKSLRLIYNFRTGSSNNINPMMPVTIWGNIGFYMLLLAGVVSLGTYFYNKSVDFKALMHKLGDGVLTHMLCYALSIWAVICTLFSLYPAFWHTVGLIRRKESLTKVVLLNNKFGASEVNENSLDQKGYYYKITPSEATSDTFIQGVSKLVSFDKEGINIAKNGAGQVIFEVNGDSFMLHSFEYASGQLTQIWYFKLNKQNKIEADKNSTTVLNGLHWRLHSLLKSKSVQVPITIVDYFSDIPFMYFAIVYAGLPNWVSIFLAICVPLGLVECFVFSTHYFKQGEFANKKYSKSGSLVYFLKITGLFSAALSAVSKFFVKIYPIYHVCLAATKSSIFAAIFAFTSSFIYAMRNLANVFNAEPTFSKYLASKFDKIDVEREGEKNGAFDSRLRSPGCC